MKILAPFSLLLMTLNSIEWLLKKIEEPEQGFFIIRLVAWKDFRDGNRAIQPDSDNREFTLNREFTTELLCSACSFYVEVLI